MTRQPLDVDLFWPQFGSWWAIFENLGRSKMAFFRQKIGWKFAFMLKLHQKDGFQTWVKYIYSESLTYTLYETIIT